MSDSEIIDWPNAEGYWMGHMDDGTWFPLHAKGLRDDMPDSKPDTILAYVVQFPQSDADWSYLFPGNHPIKQWRLPTQQEVVRIENFYRVKITTQPK